MSHKSKVIPSLFRKLVKRQAAVIATQSDDELVRQDQFSDRRQFKDRRERDDLSYVRHNTCRRSGSRRGYRQAGKPDDWYLRAGYAEEE